MRVQGIKSLVAAVSSVLAIGLILTVGGQPGDMAAVPVAAAQPAGPRFVVSTAQPDLPTVSFDDGAPIREDLPGVLASTASVTMATTEPPEEAPGEDTKVLTKPSSVPTLPIPSVTKQTSGALLSMPIQGRKTSRFGMRFHPVRHVWKLHSGLDLAAPCGTPVGAAAPGTVVRTGWAGGNGIQVKIDHGTMAGRRVMTTYNHLSAIGVQVGQKVEAHQGVGRVGTTGFSTGCHLHFEVIANGQFTNPEPWLSGGAVVVDTLGMGVSQPAVPSTSSPSPSSSASPSPAPSASSSPSQSPSQSPSTSPSQSPSPSPSTRPSQSPSPSLSPSPKPSPSPEDSPSPSPENSPSASPSPSPSAEPSSGDSPSAPGDPTTPAPVPTTPAPVPTTPAPVPTTPAPSATRVMSEPPPSSTPPATTTTPATSAPPPSVEESTPQD